MNKLTLQNDISAVLKARGITLHRLAKVAKVEYASLWRFIHTPNTNLNSDSLFKLWPVIYGEQSPSPLLAHGDGREMPNPALDADEK